MKSSILILWLISASCLATSFNDLYGAFNKLGVGSNITPMDIYKGQEGPFIHGGSAIVTAPNRNIELLHFSPPRLGIGDCNFDIHFGGLDFVSSDKLYQMGKHIVAASGAYAMSLALKQLSPQIMNQIESLQTMANEFNIFNMNSCEAGKKLVDNSIDFLQTAAQQTCQAKYMQGNSNVFGGPIKAREKCRHQKTANKAAKEAAEDKTLEDAAVVYKNIVWDAIKKSKTLSNLDNNTKYLLMSLTGTVIVMPSSDDSPPEFRTFASKIETNTAKLIEGLTSSKKVKVWACKDNNVKCLQLEDKEITINPRKTFLGQVDNMLKNIEHKVRSDNKLSSAEIEFISKTTLPIYKMIKVQTAFNRNLSLSFIHEYVELIAMDLLYQYLENSISDVTQAFNSQAAPKKVDDKFFRLINNVKNRIKNLRIQLSAKASQKVEMISRVKMLEKQLSGVISNQFFSSMGWGH